MNYCGIDLASEASAVCIVNEQGTLVREQMVATEAQEFGKALMGLGRLRFFLPVGAGTSRLNATQQAQYDALCGKNLDELTQAAGP